MRILFFRIIKRLYFINFFTKGLVFFIAFTCLFIPNRKAAIIILSISIILGIIRYSVIYLKEEEIFDDLKDFFERVYDKKLSYDTRIDFLTEHQRNYFNAFLYDEYGISRSNYKEVSKIVREIRLTQRIY